MTLIIAEFENLRECTHGHSRLPTRLNLLNLLPPHLQLTHFVLQFTDFAFEAFLFPSLLHEINAVGHSHDQEKKKDGPPRRRRGRRRKKKPS